MYLRIFLLFLVLFCSQGASAQEEPSSDDLFQQARTKAFKDDDYPAARALCKQALAKSPNYTDISVFMARLYLYDDQYDSARVILEECYRKKSQNTEVLNSLFDLENWSDHSREALGYADEYLKAEPGNEAFMLKRVKVLADLQRYKEARAALDSLIKKNPKNSQAVAYSPTLSRKSSKNRIAIGYDSDRFDKTFDPWHFSALSYAHSFRRVTIFGRVNYANRFLTNGLQYELEAYPDVSKKMYAYVSAALSPDRLFPGYRFGASLYRSLPAAFEADLGFRYLSFSGDPTIIYTGSVGKYYGSYWFSLRTFITPGTAGISESLFFISRRYFSSANHFLSLTLGLGASPDESTRDLFLLNKRSSLQAQKIRLSYEVPLTSLISIDMRVGYEDQEYRTDQYRKDYSFGATLEKRF